MEVMFAKRFIFLFSALMFGIHYTGTAQDETLYVRVVDIVVKAAFLDTFTATLTKEITASIPSEPGTLTLHAV